MTKYGVFSDPYFPAFGLNTERYGREKTPYLDTFHAVLQTAKGILNSLICTANFSNNFNSIFNKKIQKLFCICADSMLKKEEQIAYLEYSLLITKIHHMSH